MYGKHFASMYCGSMVGSGPVVFAVWGYIIANIHQKTGTVEINNKILSTILGCPETEIESAIKYLCSPDPNSRSKECDGKRLVKIGQFLYEIPTAKKYNSILNEEERREYNRVKKQESRQKQRMSNNVNDNLDNHGQSAMSAQVEEEVYVKEEVKEKNKTNKGNTPLDNVTLTVKERVSGFKKPTDLEITDYAKSIDYDLDGKEFIDWYESNGWKVGKNTMKDWKAAVRTWKRRNKPTKGKVDWDEVDKLLEKNNENK
jgi:hypothetical protein